MWVSCEGENPADNENIGPIRFLPTMGFQGQYFPFQNQDGYHSPLVAVHFERPRRKYNTYILLIRGSPLNEKCQSFPKIANCVLRSIFHTQ